MSIKEEERKKMVAELQKALESDLSTRHGPMMTGDALVEALGYPSHAAFRQSLVRGKTAVKIFTLTHRRGKFALVKDVAQHLAEQRYNAIFKPNDYQRRSWGGEPCNTNVKL